MLWRLQHTLTVGAHPSTVATIEVSTISGSAHSHATDDHIYIESAPVTCFGQFHF